MRAAAFVVGLGCIAAASSAAAASKINDIEYIRAARCRGLATGLGMNAAALDAFLKAEGRARLSYVILRADAEEARAKRYARTPERAEKARAEFDESCGTYK